MFTVHATRKLLDRVKAPVVEPCEATTLLGNWYATALFWKPLQVALVVNELTLVPVLVPLAPAKALGERIGDAVGPVLEALGVSIDVVLQETAEMQQCCFAKTASRSLTGSMNEFAFHAELRHDDGWHDLTAIAVDLADMPCGPLYGTHVTPVSALHAAIAERSGGASRLSPDGGEIEPVDEPGMLVADLSHYSDLPDDAAMSLRQLAEQLRSVVSAATSGGAGRAWPTALRCIFESADRACTGHIVVKRTDVPAAIEWQCSECGDSGTISGWQESPYDLRPKGSGSPHSGESFTATVPQKVIEVLRGILVLDPDCERIVYAAMTTRAGVELSGDLDDLEQLIGYLAFEANHEENHKRQRLLDACLDTLTAVFDEEL